MKLVTNRNSDFIVLSHSRQWNSQQFFISGEPGSGKTHFLEAIIDRFITEKGLVIIMDDAKKKLELVHGCLSPQLPVYHQNLLQYYGLQPTRINCKIWHPITMKIPKKKIPEMQFFSFPLQSLTTEDVLFLLESSEDIGNRELLTTALSKLNPKNTLYDLMQLVNKQLERKQLLNDDRKVIHIPDPNRLGLLSPRSSVTVKELNKIYSSFERFSIHPLLQPETSPFTIDPKQLFQSDSQVHLFSSMYINDTKTESFVLNKLIDFIVENKQKYFRRKVLLVFDELPHHFSQSNIFYRKMLVKKYSRLLRQDARIRGISSISASHSLSGLDKTLFRDNCFNALAIGGTTSKFDLEVLRDFFSFSTEHNRTLQKLQSGMFMAIKFPGISLTSSSYRVLRTIPARFRHAQEGDEFFELFEKEYPEKMHNYSYIVVQIKEIEKLEKEKVRKLVTQVIELDYEQQEVQQRSEKESESERKNELNQVKQELKFSKKQQKEERNKQMFEMYQHGNTFKQIGEKFCISHTAVRKQIKKQGGFENAIIPS